MGRTADYQYDAARDWVSHHQASWRRIFRRWVGRDGVQALEIGSMEGRSAVWLCEHVLTGKGAGR